MENNILRHFSANYKQIIIDEIALEGLEGVGIDLLWRRVGKRLNTELTEKIKTRYWNFIVNNNKLSFYELPEPFPHLDIIDRFTLIDETTGYLKESEEYLDGPYEYKPIENEYGSCKFYDSRIHLNNLNGMTYEKIVTKYGNRLAIVANLEERWCALAPHMPMTYLSQMTPVNYCLFELIGRSRDNGQMTVGNTNLHKIIKDSKTLFYNRKYLQDLDLVKLQNVTQVIKGKGIKCLLIRLKRFHQPGILTMPKVGMLHNVIEYLLDSPNYRERTEILIKKGVFNQKQNRRLQKTVNIFAFEDRNTTVAENSKRKASVQRKKYICLSSKSDESSDSDGDTNETPLVCQYKVGIGLLRQAYEQFLDAGLQGLTQVQLSQLLGIEFYTARAICRIFRLRNIVREYLEDKGKQRTARFIAVVATEKMDKKYEEQKNTFLEYLKKQEEDQRLDSLQESTSEYEVPLKKVKLETKSEKETDEFDMELNSKNVITEIKVLDGCDKGKSLVSFKKNPTLRQLKFANGILKVLNEKLCISGYMTLSILASKEVNETPMDTKALKSFIQKLLSDDHIKIYKMKWPGLQRYSVLICARHIKISDAVIKAKYKEICMRAAISLKINAKKETIENNPAPAKVKRSYPRYMKIQKLHEFIMNIAYFNFIKPESHSLPQGFVCVIDLCPEATVEFLINNLCTSAAAEMYQLITDNQLQLKLKDAPPIIYKALMKSKVIQNSIRVNLKVLGMLGLIQLISHHTAVTNNAGTNNYSSFLFYVNRNAKILDTSGVWPRVRDGVKEISYYFETTDDLAKYWSDVYSISTNTEIMLSHRGRKQLQSPLRSANDVHLYDTGERFGDGLGPCGFDSCFYMEIPRLWQTFYTRPNRKIVPKKKIKIKTPIVEPIKKIKAKPKARRPKKRVADRPPPRDAPLKRRRPDGSVKWTYEEDVIITVCKAAITIMSPNSQPGSLIVRNIVAKDLLSIHDPRKTKGICHTRATIIDANITLIHEKQCILNEMRRRRNLIQKYEGLLKKLRLKYSTNMSKLINKARLPMMELVWIILKVMQSKAYIQKMPCIALNLEDFNAHFTITTSANKICNMYRISETVTLKEAIIVTIMQTLECELDSKTAKKVYTIFEQFPESDLRIAVEQLRKCGAIAAKEKLFNNQLRKLDLEDIVQSSYKISVYYRRKWICRLNSDFSHIVAAIIKKDNFENDVKGTPEMNCAVCELEACNLMEIKSTAVPVITDAKGIPISPGEVSALIIDTKYSLKTGTMRLKKKSNILELYNSSNYVSFINYLSSYGRVHVNQVQNENLDTSDNVVAHLKERGEKGATFIELQDHLGFDNKTLLDKLLQLESDNVIKRVGFYENVIVLTEHYKSWSTLMDDAYVINTPWLRIIAGIKIDVFFKWANVIMNFIFEKPGSSVTYIADKSEFITYRAVQDIFMFLEKHECITVKTVQIIQPDLFSDADVEPQIFDFNPFYLPENILAFPTKNCMTKYAYIKMIVIDHYINM